MGNRKIRFSPFLTGVEFENHQPERENPEPEEKLELEKPELEELEKLEKLDPLLLENEEDELSIAARWAAAAAAMAAASRLRACFISRRASPDALTALVRAEG